MVNFTLFSVSCLFLFTLFSHLSAVMLRKAHSHQLGSSLPRKMLWNVTNKLHLTKYTQDLPNNDRIIGGHHAEQKYLNYYVYLELFTHDGPAGAICGGTMIGSKWILTAAHCFHHIKDNHKEIDAHKSSVVISPHCATDLDGSHKEFIPMEKVFIHNGHHDNGALEHDIAVIQLHKEIPPNDLHIVTFGNEPPAHEQVVAVGYGKEHNSEAPQRHEQKHVLQAELIAQDFETCMKREHAENPSFHIQEEYSVCATAPGFPTEGKPDTCGGDSGGPLFTEHDGHIEQYAVTSFSNNKHCAEAGGIAWYTRVSAYKYDIEDLMRGTPDNWFDLHELYTSR